MKIEVGTEGLEDLIKGLATEEVKQKLRLIVKRNGAELHKKAQRKAVFRGHFEGKNFVKPTGNLRRSIQPPKFASDGLSAVVRAEANYAGYVELGTRYMDAQPYMTPALEEVKPVFLAEVEEAMKK